MKISRIKIRHYRSIKDLDIQINSFNTFVGPNNNGKTNLFEAIRWFYTATSSADEEYFDRNTSSTISVELFFDNVKEEDVDKLKTNAHKTKIKKLLDNDNCFSIKKTSSDHKRKYYVGNKGKGNPSGLDTAINEFIPRLEYIDTKIRLDDVNQYKSRNPIGTMLHGVLDQIIHDNEDYIAFKEQFDKLFKNKDSEVHKNLRVIEKDVEIYLQKQFPEGAVVDFDISNPEFSDLLKGFNTQVDDGVKTNASSKGDGMQRAIMLAIIQVYADYRKRQNNGGTFLFLIDEAEIHLHPSAQRKLKQALREIADAGDQVLLNTHSSVLVVDSRNNEKVFRVEKNNKATNILEVSDTEKLNIIFDLLGGSPADLLLPSNFLIVEGKSDYEFIRKIIEKFYPDEYKDIAIIFAGGDIKRERETFYALHETYKPLLTNNGIYKEKAIIICDKPNTQNKKHYDQFMTSHPWIKKGEQIHILPVDALEKYYPNPYKKSDAEIKELNVGGKVELAQQASENITQGVFEEEMMVIFEALKKCKKKGF